MRAGHPTVYIIDPAIRWESNRDVAEEVQTMKRDTYESCFEDLKSKYPIGNRGCEVIGLWFGARGTISRQVVDFFERFELDKNALPDIAETILVASVHMISAHICDAM